MSNHQKKIFISYRREPTKYLAHALFKELRKRGYDVFWDIEGIGAGKFEKVILAEILARPFFIVLLAYGTLDRVYEANDWLRREIEFAIENDRIIIPILVDDFSFSAEKYLQIGNLAKLAEYNAASLHVEYFDASIDNLVTKHLQADLSDVELQSIAVSEAIAASEIIDIAIETPEPTIEQLQNEAEKQLSAETSFNRAKERLLEKQDPQGMLDLYQAITDDPKYVKEQINILLKIDRSKPIFLSYSRKDSLMMKSVYDSLLEAKLDVWTDESIELCTPSWRDDIANAIKACGCLIVILSPRAYDSKWVNIEIGYAENHQKKIFPILAYGDEKTSIPFSLTLSQWVDIRQPEYYEPEMTRLIDTIRKYLNSK